MWRLLNFLFGWQYVWVHDVSDHHVCRVQKLPDGRLIGTIGSRSFFITKDGKVSGGYNIRAWSPLTWNK